MQKVYLLPEKARFYKANLHGHTNISDGNWTPEEYAANYKRAGYSIIAITDHEVYRWHKKLTQEDFVCLAAGEISINTPEDGTKRLWNTCKTYHFNFYDTNPVAREKDFAFTLPSCELHGNTPAINEWLAGMQQQGFLGCYNHPYWSLQDSGDYSGLKNLFAMEIYNHGCELDGLYGYAPQAYDEMLRGGARLCCVSTDDNHNSVGAGSQYSDSFGGFTMMAMQDLSYKSVIEAMQQKHFYASTGPEIKQLYIEDNVLHIRCSPVEKIYVIMEGRKCHKEIATPGGMLYTASFPLGDDWSWLRVDCRDNHGRHAYSNAYFKDELPSAE